MSSRSDRAAYARDLYARSERQRLYRINASRFQRGAPLISSLSETKLRKPMVEAD